MATELVERARVAMYSTISTPDRRSARRPTPAARALKLVVESYPFTPDPFPTVICFQSNGICSATPKAPHFIYRAGHPGAGLAGPGWPTCNSLFAYPAQSDYSGVRACPLRVISGARRCGWD